MDSCNVQLTDTGKNINGMDQLIADRLKAGIRVWKTLPTTTTYNQQNLIDYTA